MSMFLRVQSVFLAELLAELLELPTMIRLNSCSKMVLRWIVVPRAA